jgi:hypothetical protein
MYICRCSTRRDLLRAADDVPASTKDSKVTWVELPGSKTNALSEKRPCSAVLSQTYTAVASELNVSWMDFEPAGAVVTVCVTVAFGSRNSEGFASGNRLRLISFLAAFSTVTRSMQLCAPCEQSAPLRTAAKSGQSAWLIVLAIGPPSLAQKKPMAPPPAGSATSRWWRSVTVPSR